MKSKFLKKPVNAKAFLLSIALLITSHWLCAQLNKSAMFAEIENQLIQHRVTISQVLTNKDYEILHPETTFRELVKKYASADPVEITTGNEPGKKIKIIVTLENKDGKLLPGVLVYLYHTDSRGWYAADAPHVLMNEGDRRHARLFCYVKTNEKGQLEIQTVKPSGYPQSDLPAHIHIELDAGSNGNKISELLFDDDERLKGSIRTNAGKEGFIIARPEATQAPFIQQFTYTIKI